MELIKVIVVFVAILVLLNLKLPLFSGMLGGTVLLLIFFGIGIPEFGDIAFRSVTSWGTLEVVIALYVIILLQRMLEKRKFLTLAQESLNGLMKDRRLNAAFASIFIGMMPSAAAVTICGKIMDDTAGDHLTKPEKAFCANYYRHIPEGVLPTYPLIIIACSLSGVPVSSFLFGMIPPVIILIALGYFFYLRKIPKIDDRPSSGPTVKLSKKENLKNLAKSLWTIFFAIVFIIAFDIPTWIAVSGVIVVSIFVDHFKPAEMKEMIISAFEWKTVLGTFCVFIFKDVLISAGLLELLPGYFSKLPIPVYLTLALLFFFGTMVASSTAVGSAFVPLAFTMLPGGMPLLILLMGFSFAASQMTPTHVCLAVVTEYFGISLGALLKKTLPVMFTYCVILVGYYLLLGIF